MDGRNQLGYGSGHACEANQAIGFLVLLGSPCYEWAVNEPTWVGGWGPQYHVLNRGRLGSAVRVRGDVKLTV